MRFLGVTETKSSEKRSANLTSASRIAARVFAAIVMLNSFPAWAAGAEQTKAREILDATVLAHGGYAAVAGLRDTVAVGQIRNYRPDGTSAQHSVTISSRGSDQLRTETRGPGLERVYVSNGRVGAVLQDGVKTALSPYAVANNLTSVNPVVGLLGSHLSGRIELTYGGTVVQDGKQFYLITASLPDRDANRLNSGKPIDREFDILIDVGTSLIASASWIHQSIRGRSEKTQHECRYSDYRRTESGLVVPFRVEKLLYGTKRAEILFDSFQPASLGSVFDEP